MGNKKGLTISKRDLARIQVIEFGKILFNMQIVMAIVFASPLPFAIYPLYYAALVLISVFTGFIIFLTPNFAALWNPSKINSVMSWLLGSWNFTVPIVIGISLLSILCLCADKNNKHIRRITASIIIIVLVIIYLIFRLSFIDYGGGIQ